MWVGGNQYKISQTLADSQQSQACTLAEHQHTRSQVRQANVLIFELRKYFSTFIRLDLSKTQSFPHKALIKIKIETK